MSAAINLIAPAYRNQENAQEFAEYLEENCVWKADDFYGDYAWVCDIPPRSEWAKDLKELNEHLAKQN